LTEATGQGGHNFLKSTTPLAKNIITNPPYGTHGLGDAFVRRALIHARKTGGSVAMLLNLRSLCNPDRTPRFQRCPPTALYALDELTCWPEGKPVSRQARIARQQYYWAVWHPGKVERPSFWWSGTPPRKRGFLFASQVVILLLRGFEVRGRLRLPSSSTDDRPVTLWRAFSLRS
jgi:hypothetical protein